MSLFFFFSFHVFHSSSSPLSAPRAAVSGAVSSFHGTLSPLAPRGWRLRHTRLFWGCKIKNVCMPACLYVEGVSLSSGDNHTASLVFLLLISVRGRMVGECQLSLQHLFAANNSLCRCLVLADGSPIVSSLLTQNNNADECHLLVRVPPPSPPVGLKRSLPAFSPRLSPLTSSRRGAA